MADITTGLIAYWKFDEGSGTIAADSSGNGNNGTLVGSPTWVAGKFGGALQFNGSNQYVTLPNSVGINTSFSFSSWVNISSSNNGWIYGKGSDSSDGWGVQLYVSLSNIAFYIVTGGALQQISVNVNLNIGSWNHVLITFDSTNKLICLYLNGILLGTSTTAGSTVRGTTDVYLAHYSTGFFSGILDDVRIYSRALSQDDITALYNYNPTTTTTTTTTTNITASTALSGGWVFTPNEVTYGVCYSNIDIVPTLSDPHTIDGTITSGYTNFTTELTDLNTMANYYVCSYATDSGGTTYYGNVQTFKTLQNGIIINTISIAVDCGLIPPIMKQYSKISTVGIAIDCGTIPPKNYFHPKITVLGIALDPQPIESILYFQIL